jgi:uroporphyrinogen decarboxylase
VEACDVKRDERLAAALAGRHPDRPPVSAWGHFFARETNAADFADAMIEFQEAHDWDFLKVHARASYHVEGWGFRYRAATDSAGGHVCIGHPINTPDDWRTLRPLPLDTPALAEQLDALARIRRRIPPDLPLIMTVFSPLDIAEKLIDRDAAMLKAHIERDAEAVEAALGVMAETFAAFVRELVSAGVDGIYFSTKWANDRKLTRDQYERLVRPFDLAVLAEARPMWCNMLHLCEDYVQLDAMADYPVHLWHWDSHAGHNPGFDEGRATLARAVGGGVDAKTLAQGTPEQVSAKAREAMAATGGTGFVLGPGCSIQVARTSPDNLRAMRRAAEI